MKIITTTTINPPTAAIREYDRMPDWNLIVVGDERTPPYKLERGTYISWEEQQAHHPKFCDLLGPNSVQRGRMIAFIEAYKRGCTVMASVDDDCYPMRGWGSEGSIHVGKPTVVSMALTPDIAFNPLGSASIRHRGLPREVPCDQKLTKHVVTVVPLVQENLSLGQPDVDAIERIALMPQAVAHPTEMYENPFGSTSFCPINTQNTFFAREAIPDFYGNIPGIGRMDDIWAGYLFQAMHPGTVIYASANNVQMQNRTMDSMLHDLKEEMFGYAHTMSFLAWAVDGMKDAWLEEFIPEIGIKAIDIYRDEFA